MGITERTYLWVVDVDLLAHLQPSQASNAAVQIRTWLHAASRRLGGRDFVPRQHSQKGEQVQRSRRAR